LEMKKKERNHTTEGCKEIWVAQPRQGLEKIPQLTKRMCKAPIEARNKIKRKVGKKEKERERTKIELILILN